MDDPTRAHPSCSTSGCSSRPRRPPRPTSLRRCRRCPRPTTTGLRPQPSPGRAGHRRGDPGLRHRHPGRHRAPVSIRAYMFRVGPVVAKVLAGVATISAAPGGGHRARRRCANAGGGPPAPGSPRPRRPHARTQRQPCCRPCRAATWCPAARAHPGTTSRRPAHPTSQRLWEGEVVTLVCAPTDADVEVTYSGFDTADHMGAAYQSSLDTIDLSDMADSCDARHIHRLVPAGRRAGGSAHLLAGGCRPGDHVVR